MKPFDKRAFLDKTFATSLDAIIFTDEKGYILEVNQAYAELTGYKKEEIIGKHTSKFSPMKEGSYECTTGELIQIDKKFSEQLKATMKTYVEVGKLQNVMGYQLRKDRKVVPVEDTMVFLVGDDGERIGGVAVIRDNTVRRKAEIEVSKTSDYLGNIIESSLDGIVVSDNMGYITRTNKAFLKMLGYREEEIIGRHLIECAPLEEGDYTSTTGEILEINDNYFKSMKTAMASFLHDGKVTNRRTFYLTKDKKLLPAEDSLVFLFDDKGNRIGAVGVVRDISEQRQAEERLRDSEEQARALLNVPFDVVLLLDKNGTTLDCNKTYAERFNKSTDQLKGTCCWDLFPPEVVKSRKRVIERVFQTGKPMRAVDERQGRFLDSVTYPIFGKEGTVTKVAVFSHDVTDQKQTEQALKQSEEKYFKLIEHANDAILSINREGIIIGFNKSAEKLYGYSSEEIIGKPSNVLAAREYKDFEKGIIDNFKKFGSTFPIDQKMLEGKALRKNEEEIEVEFSYYVIVVAGEPILTGIARDISSRKEKEKKILSYQKQLKSLTEELMITEQKERRYFADFLHDEIGQQLFATRLQLEQLKDFLSSAENNEIIDKALHNLCQVINQTRSLTTELSSPILNQLGLEKALEWLSEETHKKYDIQVKFEDDNQAKPLNDKMKNFLYQAVSELLTNVAKHAQAKNANLSIKRNNSNIRICVEDNGVGFLFPNEHSFDIEPKGFGLFRIKERLESLGGKLEIESQPNCGTVVTLTVPLGNSIEN